MRKIVEIDDDSIDTLWRRMVYVMSCIVIQHLALWDYMLRKINLKAIFSPYMSFCHLLPLVVRKSKQATHIINFITFIIKSCIFVISKHSILYSILSKQVATQIENFMYIICWVYYFKPFLSTTLHRDQFVMSISKLVNLSNSSSTQVDSHMLLDTPHLFLFTINFQIFTKQLNEKTSKSLCPWLCRLSFTCWCFCT